MAVTDSTAAPGAITTAAGAARTTGGAASSLAGDMKSFLTLLTTQLRNQDPMQPLDPNQFTTQLSQFAAVEQQIATNRAMESLLAVQNASAMLAAAPLLGEEITVASTEVGLQDGRAQALNLPARQEAGGAAGAVITVTDSRGTLLRQAAMPLGAGATRWQWDGRDARGNSLGDGTYRIAVSGTDASGVATGALDTSVTGTVTNITRAGGAPRLSLGGLTVGLEALRGL